MVAKNKEKEVVKKVVVKSKNEAKITKTKSNKTASKTVETEDTQVEMVVVIINRGYADLVVDASRECGATGATILHGRGSVKKDKLTKGISIDKEVVLILVKKEIRQLVMKNISDKTHLYENGKGVCFCLPVTDAKGISQFEKKLEYAKKNK